MTPHALALIVFCQSLVGMQEIPIGSNRGPLIDEANRSCEVDLGSPWCASIAHLAYDKAGMPDRPGAYSPSWYQKSKVIQADKVQPGDTALVWFPSKGRYAHTIACVERVVTRLGQVTEVITLEGNTNKQGSREGDGFYRRIRSVKTLTFVRWTI